jgi:uncharacterized protein YunC (DUF1805 family)
MAQPDSDVAIYAVDSITHISDQHRGQVVAAASHGAVYAAYMAAKGGVRAVILNDAGVGKGQAGISGLPYLDGFGIAGATISHRSARIGDGADMLARGEISHVNETAKALGCRPGQSCAECAELMKSAPLVSVTPPEQSESRTLLRAEEGEPEVWGADSASLVLPEDSDHIVITGSHGQLLGDQPATALKYNALAAVYSDAGLGIDRAGISRLPALDNRGIPAATVSADSARIGDARSLYQEGVISSVNETAAALGAKPGMTTRDFVACIIAAKKK